MQNNSIGKSIYQSYKDDFWYKNSIHEVTAALKTSKDGLKSEEAEKRINEFGNNNIEDKKKFNGLRLLIKKFNSIIIYVLLITAIISLHLEHFIEFYTIIAVILFTVMLGFIHEYRAEKSVEALSKLTAKKVQLIRNKKIIEELAENVVPGDIVILKRGVIVPADLRIIESNSLSINESILTGESVAKNKSSEKIKNEHAQISEERDIAFSGTSVMNGNGIGVVFATGMKTEIGKISEKLASIKDQKTPLQKKIDRMSSKISYTVISISIFAFLFLIMRGEELSSALILVAVLAVAGIPEEFPLSLTMALATGVRRMAHSNAIVKDMSSVETLGTTTVICTDKTGTLTQNKMMVVKYNIGEDDIDVEGMPYNPKATFKKKGNIISGKSIVKNDNFFKVAILCNNSNIIRKRGKWTLSGEPTEGALLGLAKSAGYNEEKIRKENKIIFEEPFDSSKKYMVTVTSKNKENTAHLKGAVEKVLNKCVYIYSNGKITRLNKKDKEKIENQMLSYSSQALRVLALAHKNISKGNIGEKKINSEIKDGFIFDGIVGIEDPIREEVVDSVKHCKTAGIRIIMITGDHKNTAYSIGERLGIISSEYNKVLEGYEIDEMTDKQLDNIMSHTAIFARTTPEHKFRIVQSLQREGEIVAMTGDGVNDAPALKKADIGVSMGKEGTDVAREASNMVLSDDAFSSIVEAVREGRTIYNNIRRFTYYLLTVNAAEVGIILLAILLGLATPLTALMILFINTIISSFPALGLSIEPTKEKVMHYLPRDPKEKLLSKYILLKISIVLPMMIAGALGLFMWELNFGMGNIDKARTLAFGTIIISELFHAFNARSLHISIFKHGMLRNRYFYTGMLIAIIMFVLSIYTNSGNNLLGTVPLNGAEWLMIIGIGSTVLFVTEIVKLITKTELEEEKKYQGSKLVIE